MSVERKIAVGIWQRPRLLEMEGFELAQSLNDALHLIKLSLLIKRRLNLENGSLLMPDFAVKISKWGFRKKSSFELRAQKAGNNGVRNVQTALCLKGSTERVIVSKTDA